MNAKRLTTSLLGITLLLSLCAGVRAEPSAKAPSGPPDRVRSFNFTYHADIPVSNPAAKKFEAWIPLPREDAFQQVRDLKIETPVHFEIVAGVYDYGQIFGGHRVREAYEQLRGSDSAGERDDFHQ